MPIHQQPSGAGGYECMAKEAKKYSHVLATNELAKFGPQDVSTQDFVYELLRISVEYGEGQIDRLKDGRINPAKDDVTFLVKKLIGFGTDSSDRYLCLEGITDGLLSEVRKRFVNSKAITNDHIFYYAYFVVFVNSPTVIMAFNTTDEWESENAKNDAPIYLVLILYYLFLVFSVMYSNVKFSAITFQKEQKY